MQAKIGDIIRRQDGHRFRLSGVMGNDYVADDLDGGFSAPHRFSLGELLTGFNIDGVETPESDAETIARLDREENAENAKYFGQGAKPQPVLPPEGSPERQFVEHAAAQIIADADALAQYELGEIETSPAVTALVDAWLDARNAAQAAEDGVKPAARRRRRT